MMRRREAAGEWNEASEHARGRDALAPPNGIGRFRACEGGVTAPRLARLSAGGLAMDA